MGRELGRPAHIVTMSSLLNLSMASGWRSKHGRGQQPRMPNIHGPAIDRIRDRRETETGDQACKRKPTASQKIADWRVSRRNASAATGRPAARPTGWIFTAAARMRSEHYLGGIEVNEIIVQLLEDAGNTTQVIPAEDAIFFDLPVHAGADDESTGHLTVLCLPRLLITLHAQPIGSLETLATFIQRTSLLSASTTSALVCLILTLLTTLSNTGGAEDERPSQRSGRPDGS